MPIMRLDKFISQQKNITRSESRKLIKSGCVGVNGSAEKDINSKINTDDDRIAISGETVGYKPFIYIMLNKPSGIISASDDKSRQTVVDILPPELKRKNLFPVGRLDRDTTGLLLITDDGDFAHYVISPKSMLPKNYTVWLDGNVGEDTVKMFKNGVTLKDGTKCMSAELIIDENDAAKCTVTIYEGKYHQIKRMFGVAGLGVERLHRNSIGELMLDNSLACGQARELTRNELVGIHYNVDVYNK